MNEAGNYRRDCKQKYNSKTHPLTEDQFVNVSSKHRTSREDAAVRRRHHRRRYRSKPEEGDEVRCQVLQDQRQNHAGLRLRERKRAFIVRLVPSCDIIIITQLILHSLVNICSINWVSIIVSLISFYFCIRYHIHVIVIWFHVSLCHQSVCMGCFQRGMYLISFYHVVTALYMHG